VNWADLLRTFFQLSFGYDYNDVLPGGEPKPVHVCSFDLEFSHQNNTSEKMLGDATTWTDRILFATPAGTVDIGCNNPKFDAAAQNIVAQMLGDFR
jgi:hypothetical protein